MKSSLCLFSSIIFVLLISSCKPVKQLVNRNYKPLTVADQQIKSIKTNLNYIDTLKPNIGIRIGKSILEDFLPKEIENSAKEIKGSNIEMHEFTAKIGLERQAIVINANFETSFHDIQAKIKGSFQGYVTVSSTNDSIFFPYAFKTLKVKNIEFTTKKPKLSNRAIALLIKPILNNFLDNLNGEFIKKTPSIYSGWGQLISLNPDELFSNNETTISGSNLALSRYVKNTSILIDKKGVSVMLSLEKNRINTVLKLDTISSSTQKLQSLYKDYRIKYSKLWIENFKPYTEDTKLALSITKPTVAGIFNDIFSGANIKISHNINIPKVSSNDKMEIDRLKVNCGDLRSKFSFPDFPGKNKCKYSCMKSIKIKIWPFKFKTKRIEDPFCAAARATCKIGRETARVAWQTARETARIANQVSNEATVAACKLVVEASELINAGRIKTSSQGSGLANLYLNNIQVNNDLSGMSLNTKGGVKLRLKSYLKLEPQDLGFIAMCQLNYSNNINTNLSGTIFNQFSKIDFSPVNDGEDIVITGKVAPLGYKAKADLSPLYELLLDPQFALKCSPLYSTLFVGGLAGGVATLLGLVDDPALKLLLKGSVVDTYKIEPFTQRLKPIMFTINNGLERKANVSWGFNSIDYDY